VIKITTSSGLTGWGEASPFSWITGDSQESNYEAAQQLGRLMLGRDALAIEARVTEMAEFTVSEPSIRSAFDMGLHDLLGKAANLPLYVVLGGSLRHIRTDYTIGLQQTVEQSVARAQDALAQGFDALKLKVGRPGFEDVAHVKAVRECAGPNVLIKIDSNQGWDYPTALANIQAMESLQLQYSEQPLAAWDIDNMRRLRDGVSLPICADESVFTDKDAQRVTAAGAADYLNIKLGKAGGIHNALKINAVSEAAGCKCMIGCFSESRMGLTAAAHVAIARPNISFIDLDSAFSFAEDPVLGGIQFDEILGGVINMPTSPGLGAAFDEKQLEQHVRVAS